MPVKRANRYPQHEIEEKKRMSLIEEIQQFKQACIAEGWRVYAEILQRSDTPEEKDAERIKAAMELAGIDPSRMEQDLAVLKEAARLEAVKRSLPRDLSEQVKAAGDELEAHRAETARIAQEREAKEGELLDRLRDLQRKGIGPRDAGKALVRLKKANWRLFGLDEPPKPIEQQPRPAFRVSE